MVFWGKNNIKEAWDRVINHLAKKSRVSLSSSETVEGKRMLEPGDIPIQTKRQAYD